MLRCRGVRKLAAVWNFVKINVSFHSNIGKCEMRLHGGVVKQFYIV